MNLIQSTHRKRRKSRRRSSKKRLGATAVEFAIVANIFFLLIFTCMEFARMNMVRNLAHDAAYYAARDAMVPGATEAEAIAKANEVMNMMLTNGYTVSISGLGTNVAEVEVTVTVDFNEVALFAPRFLPNAVIETTAKVKSERYDGFFEL